ncbi:cell polarity protein [Schistosoma mansoni]|uniref:cell polarity protein n=1 Tax=Schistosoma mansoni TaxID=6183 RepID=UPI0001A6264C|nr:cell polarity protein [Schistosoma mansoni]|eukprot:XP_018646082.1 cell polarity protein [Schistosoma mansoni]
MKAEHSALLPFACDVDCSTPSPPPLSARSTHNNNSYLELFPSQPTNTTATLQRNFSYSPTDSKNYTIKHTSNSTHSTVTPVNEEENNRQPSQHQKPHRQRRKQHHHHENLSSFHRHSALRQSLGGINVLTHHVNAINQDSSEPDNEISPKSCDNNVKDIRKCTPRRGDDKSTDYQSSASSSIHTNSSRFRLVPKVIQSEYCLPRVHIHSYNIPFQLDDIIVGVNNHKLSIMSEAEALQYVYNAFKDAEHYTVDVDILRSSLSSRKSFNNESSSTMLKQSLITRQKSDSGYSNSVEVNIPSNPHRPRRRREGGCTNYSSCEITPERSPYKNDKKGVCVLELALLSQAHKLKPSTKDPNAFNTRTIGQTMHIQLTKMSSTGLGFTLTSRDTQTQSSQMSDPVYVKKILPDGAAIQDGRLLAGDRLLAIDGEEVRSLNQVLSQLRSLTPGKQVDLLISRQISSDLDSNTRKSSHKHLPPRPFMTCTFEYQLPLDTTTNNQSDTIKGPPLLGINFKCLVPDTLVTSNNRVTVKTGDRLVAINDESVDGMNAKTIVNKLKNVIKQCHERNISSSGQSPASFTLTVHRYKNQSDRRSSVGDTLKPSSAHPPRHTKTTRDEAVEKGHPGHSKLNSPVDSHDSCSLSFKLSDNRRRLLHRSDSISSDIGSHILHHDYHGDSHSHLSSQRSDIHEDNHLLSTESSLKVNYPTSRNLSVPSNRNFLRDGFGRRSVSEKRHGHVDASHYSFFQTNILPNRYKMPEDVDKQYSTMPTTRRLKMHKARLAAAAAATTNVDSYSSIGGGGLMFNNSTSCTSSGPLKALHPLDNLLPQSLSNSSYRVYKTIDKVERPHSKSRPEIHSNNNSISVKDLKSSSHSISNNNLPTEQKPNKTGRISLKNLFRIGNSKTESDLSGDYLLHNSDQSKASSETSTVLSKKQLRRLSVPEHQFTNNLITSTKLIDKIQEKNSYSTPPPPPHSSTATTIPSSLSKLLNTTTHCMNSNIICNDSMYKTLSPNIMHNNPTNYKTISVNHPYCPPPDISPPPLPPRVSYSTPYVLTTKSNHSKMIKYHPLPEQQSNNNSTMIDKTKQNKRKKSSYSMTTSVVSSYSTNHQSLSSPRITSTASSPAYGLTFNAVEPTSNKKSNFSHDDNNNSLLANDNSRGRRRRHHHHQQDGILSESSIKPQTPAIYMNSKQIIKDCNKKSTPSPHRSRSTHARLPLNDNITTTTNTVATIMSTMNSPESIHYYQAPLISSHSVLMSTPRRHRHLQDGRKSEYYLNNRKQQVTMQEASLIVPFSMDKLITPKRSIHHQH